MALIRSPLSIASRSRRTTADRSRISVPGNRGIKVVRSVTIDRPVGDLFLFWRRLENLPRFMRHLESVRMLDEKRSHWIAKAPLGQHIAWDAEIINEHPNELIAWRSCDDSPAPNAGSVRFKEAPAGRGTEVTVALEYLPPAGKLGKAIGKLFGEEPSLQVSDDLRRFKCFMETGEVPTTTNQPRGGNL